MIFDWDKIDPTEPDVSSIPRLASELSFWLKMVWVGSVTGNQKGPDHRAPLSQAVITSVRLTLRAVEIKCDNLCATKGFWMEWNDQGGSVSWCRARTTPRAQFSFIANELSPALRKSVKTASVGWSRWQTGQGVGRIVGGQDRGEQSRV